MRRIHLPTIHVCVLAICLVAMPSSEARSEFPGVDEFLGAMGFSRSDANAARHGQILRGTLPASSERELVTTLAFIVTVTPDELVNSGLQGILERVDPNVISWENMGATADVSSLARLDLQPDAAKRAQAYLNASPDERLNLSTAELARFRSLGPKAPVEAVERVLREVLAARVAAYRSMGLDGIEPYAREGGTERSPAADLRAATESLKKLDDWFPTAFKAFLEYPRDSPAGIREQFRWSEINAHGVPTLVLGHLAFIPDGSGAWIVLQRQFYVSEGYNCEQAVAALLPVEEGTAVFYVNRTSTDQVMGFGGGVRRSIGSQLMASQLEALFGRLRAAAPRSD